MKFFNLLMSLVLLTGTLSTFCLDEAEQEQIREEFNKLYNLRDLQGVIYRHKVLRTQDPELTEERRLLELNTILKAIIEKWEHSKRLIEAGNFDLFLGNLDIRPGQFRGCLLTELKASIQEYFSEFERLLVAAKGKRFANPGYISEIQEKLDDARRLLQ